VRAAGGPRPRAGWKAVLYTAARWPRRWFTIRRLVWLACIAFSGFVIWGAGTHLGPGLRAAHGAGIPGLWTAQQQDSGKWTGEFVSASGTVTLPDVSYAGSLSVIADGTTVPALDAGAGDEVYPLTGSDKWVHDLIGVIGGTLALVALLVRGFFVARRRRRAPPADYLTQAVSPRERERTRRRRPAAPQSRAGKLALLALGGGVAAWASAKFILLLADVRPYTGWYWLLAVAAGIVVAVALPWMLVRWALGPARWAGWLMLGYPIALAVGLRYYLSARFTPPSSVPGVVPAPPPLFVLEMAGLSAEALTFVVVTLLMLAFMVEVVAPGRVGRWLRARRKSTPPAHARDHGLANTPDREP
jgi:hypothetical protein